MTEGSGERSGDGPAARLSLWAIASVVCSAAICPPLCAIGPVLGGFALVQIRYRATIRGRGLALLGIAIGILATCGWIGALGWWHVNVRRPLLEGPARELVAGFAGDVDGFRAGFIERPGDDGTEAAAFIATLRHRYGDFRTAHRAVETLPGEAAAIDRWRPRLRYRLEFEGQTVDAEAVFVIRSDDGAGRGGRLIHRFAEFSVLDADRGDLAYPIAPRAGAEGVESLDAGTR